MTVIISHFPAEELAVREAPSSGTVLHQVAGSGNFQCVDLPQFSAKSQAHDQPKPSLPPAARDDDAPLR
jgi:hypothetical protein